MAGCRRAGPGTIAAPPAPAIFAIPPRRNLTDERLGGLFPVFRKYGTVLPGGDDHTGMVAPPGHLLASLPPRRALAAAVSAVAVLLAAGGRLPAQTDGVPRLPDPVRTSQTTFAIPFKVAPSRQDDQAATKVLLQASTDLGGTWQAAGEAAPGAGSIVYRAAADGEIWFRLRAVDTKGRQRGGEGPDMRVIVDAAAPRVAARVWRGADGEIVCRYAAADDTLDPANVVIEYRTQTEPAFKRVATEAVLSRESPAHLIGEEIWWAGEKVEALMVRITVADTGGHRTVKQFEMQPSDPGVDQAALAAEIGVPALPGTGGSFAPPAQASPRPALAADAPPPDVPTTPPGGWSAETSVRWTGESASSLEHPSPGSRSVLARPVGTGPLAEQTGAPPIPAPPPATPSLEAAAPSGAGAVRALPTEYRGRPLHIVGSRRFSWEYEMQVDRPDAGPVRVELWSTTDGGFTWHRAAVDDDARSPIEVTLPTAGLYGFRLDIVPDVPGAGGGPRSGEIPDGWIGIDDDPPQVEIVEATRLEGEATGTVLVRWSARDKLLAPASVRLLHSPNPDGPWATIQEGLAGEGDIRWAPERGVPARVYLRCEATDAAGNVGRATTTEPVTIAVPRAVGKLGGVKVSRPAGAP